MFEPDLHRLRTSIREEDYDLRLHALEKLEEAGLSILDVESCVLTGSVVERQRDRTTNEWKYVIEGRAPDGLAVTVVAKWDAAARMVIVTVFRT
ncbi:MAG: DUF4258 domain-containing protein [Planctomycetota bacterium]